MSVNGRSIFNGSVRGWCEQVRSGYIPLEVVKVQYKDESKESRLYNVFQLENGHRKDIYFPTPNSELRKFSFINGAVTHSWCTKSVEQEDPDKVTKDDADTYAMYEVMEIISQKVCEAEGLNPDTYPPRFTTENREGEAFAWYDAPTNNSNSKSPWRYESWLCSPGIPTFKIRSALVVPACVTSRNENRENHISIKFGLGRNKWVNNRQGPVMHAKRTIEEIEKGRLVCQEPLSKKTCRVLPSKAALQKMKAMEKETDSPIPVVLEC